ncbi:regulator of G-protein signaling 12-like isoform X2 [Varroa jacobsoni]|nr:regulator of G-protein signaling 12-like isoform X3 [Varroa destructor]XP_022650693.1 regulator of G-protein signaling 12-like isoform X3 [Varroa destructor]XP_022688205.1 regulator of G-protein signaling 12-like isoform X2 [Varroa jacobsoni]XP_022688206.1 regulator of G-protein signaling 12-like isoform X2 [Varroa jacobsoni]XP_022688208.1 regulator of G-protein signaling 12-like isoform X2 [Varroa jacobsoni]XP_022688209.1 regulator of G-protein signaling 12-like isoform X2 [Varroa jacobson
MAVAPVKTVRVNRGPTGFGITLSGQHPCILSSVHEESEAFQAGLRHGDRLLKVNGVPVDKAAHDEVVSVIARSGSSLTLCIAPGIAHGGGPLDALSSSDEDEDFIQSQAHFIIEQVHNKRLAGELLEGTNSSAELVNILFNRNARPSYAASQHHRAAFGGLAVADTGGSIWPSQQNYVRAVLSYLGSVSSSSSEQNWAQALLGQAIAQLRDQQRVLVAMQVTSDALVLSNHRGTAVARFTQDRIVFYGMDETSPSYFGVVTRQSPQQLSAHVFVADSRLVPHASHGRRARTFKIACQRDPRTNTCKEFPSTAHPILMALAKIRACSASSATAIRTGTRHIYDSDSGRDDSLERSVNSGQLGSISGLAKQNLLEDSLEDVSAKLRDLILLEKSPSKTSESQVSLDSLDVVHHYKHSPRVYSLRKQHSLDALDTPKYNDGQSRTARHNGSELYRRQSGSLNDQSLPPVASWSESLDAVLNHEDGILIFAKFLKKEFAQENIFFWTACEKYRNEKSVNQRKALAREIFDKHLKEDCAEPLNIDGPTLRDIVSQLEMGLAPKDLFTVAQEHIYNLMRMDCYPRFLKSDLYQQCLIKEVNGERLISPVKAESVDKVADLADKKNNPGFSSHPDLNGNHRPGNMSNSSASSVSTSGGSIAKARRSLFPNVKKLGKKKKDEEKRDAMYATSSLADDKYIYIIIPSGETRKIPVTGTELLPQIISDILQKNATSGASLVDVFVAQNQQPVDLGTPVSQLLQETITIEPRVAFLLALPCGIILGLKCAPTSTLWGVIQGVCLRYGLDAGQMACRLYNTTKLLDPMTQCSQLDGARLVLTLKNQRPEWHLAGQIGAGQASPWYAKGQDIQAFLAQIQSGAIVFDETGVALFSSGAPPLPPKPTKFQKPQKGHPLENTCNISFV